MLFNGKRQGGVYSFTEQHRPDGGKMIQVQITPTAQGTLDALCAYAQRHQPGGLHMREIATVAAAPVRVRKALEVAHDKEVVFFVCRGPDVYDVAFVALNVNLAQSGTVR